MLITIILVFAFVLFVLGAIPRVSSLNIVSAGLACATAAYLLSHYH